MNRTVGNWMTRGLRSAAPGDPLFRGLELMAEQGIRHVLVLEDDELRGIVSNRDVVRSTAKNPEGRLDLHGCTMEEVMTPIPLQTARPDETLGAAAGRMHQHRISALPVIEDGAVTGLLTTDDILAAVSLGDRVPLRPDL